MVKRKDRFDELVECPDCGEPARAIALDAHRAGVPCQVSRTRKRMAEKDWSLVPDSAYGYGFVLARSGIHFEVAPASYHEASKWAQKEGGAKIEMVMGTWAPTWVGVVLTSFPHRQRYAPYALLKLVSASEELQCAVCAVWELARGTERDPGEAVWEMLRELRNQEGDANGEDG